MAAAGPVLRHGLRFAWKDSSEPRMSWRKFVDEVAEGALSLTEGEIYCVQDNGKEKAFDLFLRTEGQARSVQKLCGAGAEMAPLDLFTVVGLGRMNVRLITVFTYNPYVSDRQIEEFLDTYGVVKSPVRKLTGPGKPYWDGRRQVLVELAADPEGLDGLWHPPAYFTLGADRGYLLYSRQPPSCRRCRVSGHTEASCEGLVCRRCGVVGHIARVCPAPKACHGCGSTRHLRRDCPDLRRSGAAEE